jgi:hypothetical protein
LIHHIRHKDTTWRLLLWNPITQMFLASHIFSLAIYFVNQTLHPIPPSWSLKIASNCALTEQSQHDVELHNYIQFHFSWAFLGAYFGLILDQRYLHNPLDYPHFFQTSFMTTSKRILLCAPLSIVTQLPMILVSKHSAVWKLILLRNLLPTFLGSFLIFGVSKYISRKFNLINVLNKKLD